MKQKIKMLVFLGTAYAGLCAQSPHMIVCTFEQYPEAAPLNPMAEHATNSLATLVRPTRGIYGSYFGYICASNTAGQLIFPRKHNDSAFTFLIAEHIEPIFISGNTISTWKVSDGTPYAYYTIERKQDEQTKLYFWDTQKSSLDQDRLLPLNVIMVRANPSDIYLPTGITVTSNNAQLVLPPLYVKKNMNVAQSALSWIPIRQFFENVTRTSKTEGADVQSKIAKNRG